MQTANITYGKKSTAVVIEDVDGGEQTESREVKELLGQLKTIGMELQQAEGVIGKSTGSGK